MLTQELQVAEKEKASLQREIDTLLSELAVSAKEKVQK